MGQDAAALRGLGSRGRRGRGARRRAHRGERRRGAELLIVSDDNEALDTADLALPFAPGLPEWLTPLVAVVPGQRFAMQLTIEKGLDPDKPEGLIKVTETL